MSITENNSSFPLLSFSFPSSNSSNNSNNLNIKNNTSSISSSISGNLQGGQQGQGGGLQVQGQGQQGGGQIIQQIYEGQKFFWRQRLNVDINILYNRNENYIEVISYNSDLSIELNRIYISSNILYNLIQNDITNKVNEMKKDLSRDRFKKLPSDSELYLKVGDNLMSQFILNRLIAVNENNQNIMKLSLLSADTFDLSTLVIEKNDTENQNDNIQIDTTSNSQPSSSSSSSTNTVTNQTKQNINTTETNNNTTNNNKNTNKEPLLPQKQPVKINRRRKTTSGEFDRALVNLRQHSMELNEACDRASKLTELSSKSVDSFKYALSRHSVKYDKSKPLERFKWAVKRVILNNTVDRIRQQLDKRSKDKQPLRINATFPLPDGSIINPANAAAQLQRIPLLTKIHETYSTGPSPFQSPFVTPRGKGQKNGLNNSSSSSSPPPSTINSTTTPSSSSSISNNNNNSTSKGLLTKSTSINEMDTMPSVNQRQKSVGRILMASTSMPITPNEGNLSSPTNINTTTTSPTNQSSIHLPSLKDTHKTTTTNSNSGNQKDKKKTNKK